MENETRSSWQTDPPLKATPAGQRYRAVLAWGALAAASLIFGLLTFLVLSVSSFPIDLQITLAIQSIDSRFFALLMQAASWPGFLPQSILITLLIVLVLYGYRLRWEAALSLLAAILSGGVNQLIKELVRRPRPGSELVDVFAVLESFSYPSGHVMFYTIVFGFTAYVVYTCFQPSWLRSLLLGLLGALVLLVGASRIYLGQHWASDVLGAYLLGGVMLVAVTALHPWGRSRFFRGPQTGA